VHIYLHIGVPLARLLPLSPSLSTTNTRISPTEPGGSFGKTIHPEVEVTIP
jgi:hypothetical protein